MSKIDGSPERPDSPWKSVLVLVAVAVGAAGVGNHLARDGAAGAGGASGQPAHVWHRQEPVKVDTVRPTPLTRPLALVYQAIAGGRLFSRDPNGKPMLVTDGDLGLPLTGLPAEPSKTDKAPTDSKSPSPCGDVPPTTTPRSQVVDRPTCEAVRQVRTALDRQGGHLTTVIATLPDWVDSSLKWTFDDQLDALQTASSQLDYSFVAFDLPDSEPAPIAGGDEPARFPVAKLHESTPGSLLFRRRASDANACPEWLQILLVGETPTRGVHEEALVSAIQLVQLWNMPSLAAPASSRCAPSKNRIGDSGKVIRVIGPTYSGSAASMAHALQVAIASATTIPTSYDIVTPSGSSPDNAALLNIAGVSTFRSVVHSDDHVLDGIATFLGRSTPSWQCGVGVALLVESSTSWGQRLLRNSANANTGNVCRQCTDGTELHPQPPMPCAVIVPFPLHISRLRADAKAPVSLPVQVPDGATVSLNLGETTAPVDRVPPMTPELTAATVEVMVDGMFQAIDDRRSTAIGVLATDKRDHLFLAEQIARHRPNVLMFTLESNLIYLHPDVASYTRGTVVGSTYALSERAQRLIHPELALKYPQQFGSSAGHGEFNALAMILERPDVMLAYDIPGALRDPVPGSSDGGPCRPHAPPGGCTPPVWISVVGRGALLPVAAEHARVHAAPGPNGAADGTGRDGELNEDTYITAVSSPNSPGDKPASGYLAGARMPLVLITTLVVLACWHTRRWVRPRRAEAEAARGRANARPAGPDRDRAVELTDAAIDEATASIIAARGVLTAAILWLAKLGIIYLGDATGRWWGGAQLLYGLAAVAASAPLIFSIVMRLVTSEAGQSTVRLVRGLALAYGVAVCIAIFDEWRAAWAAGALLVACAMCDFWPGSSWTAGRLRRIPVLLGMGAYACFVFHLVRDDWSTVDAVLYVERASLLTSLAAPSVVILLLLGAMYWWAIWNLRRVQLLLVPEIEVGVGRFLIQRAERSGIQADDLLRRPAMTVKDLLCLPIVAAVVGLIWGYSNAGTIEGRPFNGFLLLASVCVATTYAHSLAHTWTLGRSVQRLLRSLGMHAASSRYAEIGKEPFRWQLTFSPVRWRELEPFMRRIGNVVAALPKWPGDEAAALKQSPTFVTDLADASTKACTVSSEAGEAAAYAKGLEADDWARLDKLIDTYVTLLRKTRWADAGHAIPVCTAADDALVAMEYVVLFHAGIVLRDLLTRLVSGFTAVLGGLLLLFATHLFYTFQGRLFWLGFDALAVGGSALFAIRMLLVLERDATLSRLWGTTPGELSLFGGLTLRAAFYAAISSVTLFAVFFPEVAGDFAGWLLPLKSLVP